MKMHIGRIFLFYLIWFVGSANAAIVVSYQASLTGMNFGTAGDLTGATFSGQFSIPNFSDLYFNDNEAVTTFSGGTIGSTFFDETNTIVAVDYSCFCPAALPESSHVSEIFIQLYGAPSGKDLIPGTDDFKVTLSAFIPLLDLQSGAEFPFELQLAGTDATVAGLPNVFDPFDASAPDGQANIEGSFSVTAVPIPAGIWLFGTALVGLLATKNRNS